MLKKTITYTDFNGKQRTEDFYFNLSEAEVTEMEFSGSGGSLAANMKQVVLEEDADKIISIFKAIILKAYGKKSEDGRRFIKSEEISKEFSETPAYSKLFMEIGSNADAAVAFVNGILPKMKKQDTTKN